MSISEWLMLTMKSLGQSGADSPRRDALVLLEDTLNKDRSWVMAHPEYELSETELKSVNELIDRRINHEPLAYIRSKIMFYGRFFEVNKNVLIPRPESEDFVDLIKEINPKQVIDIGTGSGCLAITIKLELPKLSLIATDIDSNTLKVAQKNAHTYDANIKFVQSDLFEKILNNIDQQTTIIANLPYVPEGIVTSPEIKEEPTKALFSGKDGLDHYRKFWHQISELNEKPKHILTESLESQHDELSLLAQKAGYSTQSTQLLIQVFSSEG